MYTAISVVAIIVTYGNIIQGNNYTYDTDDGGFGDQNEMSIDQRGFKHFIQAEAAEFLQPDQLMLNLTVTDIAYSSEGVNVTLADGSMLVADYVLCTFSLGVLQNDDVTFVPSLPDWKQEAIQSMTMVRSMALIDAMAI